MCLGSLFKDSVMLKVDRQGSPTQRAACSEPHCFRSGTELLSVCQVVAHRHIAKLKLRNTLNQFPGRHTGNEPHRLDAVSICGH